MKTDVFVRVWPQSRLRMFLAEAVLERIRLQEDARLTILMPPHTRFTGAIAREFSPVPIGRVNEEAFASAAREYADRMARSDVYVLIDDDHMPIGRDWIRNGVSALQSRPDYAMLSAWSINGEVRDPGGEDEVFPASSCGTPCFVRKGAFANLPEAPAPEYDQVLSTYLQKEHGRVGFLRHVRFNHLGCELSQVVPGHWSA